MVKLTSQEKQDIYGGVAATMVWAIITGACLAFTTLFNVANQVAYEINEAVHPHSQSADIDVPTSRMTNGEYYHPYQQNNHSYIHQEETTRLRISPNINTSSFYLPI